ncbi:MAG: HAMP domain-containing sensor histidine kinase [Anaerolineales bacterium]|nr:HAMP domain-containing sensor histidine kinase [Anaerolineales bacterium]
MLKFTSRTFLFAAGIVIVALISLGFFYWLMRPPMSDLGLMALFLTITAIISILAGYGAYRLGWLERAPSLRWTLSGTYALASLLTFINVWLTARLMFASEHDLLLATVLLAFAGGIAIVLGVFFATTFAERLTRLEAATRAIEEGDFAARAAIPGRDEVAALAQSFNQMAQRLQTADQKQRELDALRRDLVAWAGHDLRTPLASIRLLVEALADGVATDEQTVQQYLVQAKKQIDRLSLLVEDLFQVSQLDTGSLPLQLEAASLSDLISDTLESFSALAAQSRVTLSGSAAPGVDPLMIDVQRMGRALNNLVSNALRHTPPEGRVDIHAGLTDDGVLLSISDTGEGISPDDLPYVFERFYRGEKSRSRASGGAGLGLAITRGIVEAHGGSIRVESEPGKGTVFTIVLPRR